MIEKASGSVIVMCLLCTILTFVLAIFYFYKIVKKVWNFKPKWINFISLFLEGLGLSFVLTGGISYIKVVSNGLFDNVELPKFKEILLVLLMTISAFSFIRRLFFEYVVTDKDDFKSFLIYFKDLLISTLSIIVTIEFIFIISKTLDADVITYTYEKIIQRTTMLYYLVGFIVMSLYVCLIPNYLDKLSSSFIKESKCELNLGVSNFNDNGEL